MYIRYTISARKKNELWPFAPTWLDLEGVVLSEIRQTEKGKYPHGLSYMCDLKLNNK